MQLICAGLSRTGTHSLADALTLLGYKTLHWAPERLADVVSGQTQSPDFRRYDDVDAVLDIPAAYFFRELLDAYPQARCILTVREPVEWFESIKRHYAKIEQPDPVLQTLVYGSTVPTQFLYIKKLQEHSRAVLRAIAPRKLLVMNVKEGWRPLCQFLGKEMPDCPFPHNPG